MINDSYTEEYVEINGQMQYFLHYMTSKKETAIVLHGGPGQSEAHFAYHLSEYWGFCNIVYYDQRGTGKTQLKSKTKPNNITIENLLVDLKATINYIKKKYETDRIILIAHSWGTVLGTKYIQTYPNDVTCYIGYGQVVGMRRGEKIGFEKLMEEIEKSGSSKDMQLMKNLGDYPNNVTTEDFTKTAMVFRKLQGKYGYTASYSKVIKLCLKSPIFSFRDIRPMLTCLKRNKNLMDYLLAYDTWNITKYEIPIYYILGKDDWQVPSVLAAEYFDRIEAPKKSLYWVENAGHLTDLDNPTMFYKAVGEIVETL